MEERILWAILSMLRVIWCLAPQKAYLHPDEFFQSPEVMAGDILDLDILRPWEFLPDSPCRTVLFPLLTSGTAFWIIGILHRLGFDVISCSYTLLVVPRLVITVLSFILDYTVYQIAPLYTANRWRALVLLSTSYVTLVFYTRTLSNAIEGILFALLLLLTSPPTCNVTSSLKKAKVCHLIGMVLAAGFFNRPTFLCLAIMPMLFWGLQNNLSQFSCKSILVNAFKLLPSMLVTSSIFTVADTLYYTGNYPFSMKNADLHQPRHNIILTPFNFLRYNLNTSNLAQHGVHPPVTHLAVNGPMLFGILHFSVLYTGIKEMWPKSNTKYERYSQHKARLFLFYFVPLIALSLINHQEPRFLIPLITPLALLVSSHRGTRKVKCVIVTFNVLGALFFGCFHQAGLIPSLFHIQKTVQSKVSSGNEPYHHTILFTHTYMPPHYLLGLKKGQEDVDIIDLAGFPVDNLCQKLQHIQKYLTLKNTQELGNKRQNFIIAFPGTIAPVINGCGLVYKSYNWFLPHLSMEDPPKISHLLKGNLTGYLALIVIEVEVPITR
ncbi:GPI mannosyltransferase 4 [Gastrophryne carolinensis]